MSDKRESGSTTRANFAARAARGWSCSSQRVRAGPARQREISLRRTSKACASRAGTSISQRIKSCCASLSSVSRFVPNECAGIVPSQRSSSASVSGSSGNVSPLSVNTNSFRSIRAVRLDAGRKLNPGLWVGVDRCGGAVRSPTLEKCFAAAMPGRGASCNPSIVESTRPPAPRVQIRSANRSYRKLAAGTGASGARAPGAFSCALGAAFASRTPVW